MRDNLTPYVDPRVLLQKRFLPYLVGLTVVFWQEWETLRIVALDACSTRLENVEVARLAGRTARYEAVLAAYPLLVYF